MQPQPNDQIKVHPGFWAGLHQLGIGADDIARTAQLSLQTIN